MIRRAFLLLAALLAAAPALASGAGWLESPALARLFAGEIVVGRIVLPGGRVVGFREMFAPGGALAGSGGPVEDPARWIWQGRWWVEHGSLCRSVPAVNSVSCLRVIEGEAVYRVVVPTGKLGSPASATVADLTAHAMPLAGWRVPALVIKASTLLVKD